MAHPLTVARENKGLSQKQLAEMAGVAPSAISRIELGCGARRATFLAIAAALEIPDYRQLLPEVTQ